MHALRIIPVLIAASFAFLASTVRAQDIAAAVAPASVTTGPRLLIVQKTTNGLRWRALNPTTSAWGPWTPATIPGSHYDGFNRVAVAGWSDQGTARYHAFEAVVSQAGAIEVAETTWNFANPQPVGLPPPVGAPNTAVGSFFFPADAVGRTFERSFSAFGTSVAAGPIGLVFSPRELFRPNGMRDMVTPGGGTAEVYYSAFSTTLRDSAATSFDRTTAVMHQNSAGARTVSLYSVSNVFPPMGPDNKLDLGSPPGVMTQAPLLFIHDGVNPGPMNLFTVAKDATGRRRLFERASPSNQTQLGSWSGWKDWGFRSAAPPAIIDDFELGAALVWREPSTGILRVNMFGTRGGRVIERHWNGFAWNWGALIILLPEPGMRITDGAVVTNGSNLPRLSVFAVTPAGAPFELLFDWTQGRWIWQALN